MPGQDLITVGARAGGVEATGSLSGGRPADARGSATRRRVRPGVAFPAGFPPTPGREGAPG